MFTEPSVIPLSYSPYPITNIAFAARNCYQSKSKGEESDKKLIKACVRRGHLSVIEHANASFEITGSRALTHQLVRHRMFSYAQQSQRYVTEDRIEAFFFPPSIAALHGNDPLREVYFESVDNSFFDYTNLVEGKIPKEDARYVLPNACLSTIVMTGNFRMWREFIQKRAIPEAQFEIRMVAAKVYALLLLVAPEVFEDLEVC